MAEYRAEDQEFESNAHEERMQAAREEYKGMSLKELVHRMKAMQDIKNVQETALKTTNANFDILRFELIPSKMEEDGVERVNYEGIGRVSLTADLRVSTPAGARDGLFTWLKKHKLADLITPSINSSTMKAFIKNRIKEGRELPPGDLVKVTPITRASITKG